MMLKLVISKIQNTPIKIRVLAGFIICAAVAFYSDIRILGFGSFSWREEVLLHDGKTILVERTQRLGGRSEIGQPSPVAEHTIIFRLPSFNEEIRFKSEYSSDVGRANLTLLALHVENGRPLIVATPNNFIAYYKWGEPNPPYIVFSYDGKGWGRTELSKLPLTVNKPNLLVANGDEERIKMLASKRSYISSKQLAEANAQLSNPVLREITRLPMARLKEISGGMIRSRSGWIGIGFFELARDLPACRSTCKREEVEPVDCPCERIFKGRE